MINKNLECKAIKELCKECEMAKEKRGKPCVLRTERNYFCKNCIIADNTVAWFKKIIVDENTREMHKEVKMQFSDRVANEEEWLANHGF